MSDEQNDPQPYDLTAEYQTLIPQIEALAKRLHELRMPYLLLVGFMADNDSTGCAHSWNIVKERHCTPVEAAVTFLLRLQEKNSTEEQPHTETAEAPPAEQPEEPLHHTPRPQGTRPAGPYRH